MNNIKKITTISFMLVLGFIATPLNAAKSKKLDPNEMQAKAEKEEARFPIGCRPVGFQESLKVLSLYPGKEGALQSLYFSLTNCRKQ